jgi:purine-binding chemotaxis protein CheW
MIHVRGEGVPVIDIKGRLGIGFGAGDTEHSRIIVLEVPIGAGRELVVGAVTDAVYEVSSFGEEAIDAPPEFGERWDSSFMRGLARRNGDFVTVLELARLFRADELGDLLPGRAPGW